MLKFLMDNPIHKISKDHCHYNHTDPCSPYRWTARESYEFMSARPWQKVLDFYSNVLNGSSTLSALFGSEKRLVHDDAGIPRVSDETEIMDTASGGRTGRWARATFKIVLSYCGNCFDGWQKQPGLNTVQGLVEQALGKFVDVDKVRRLEEKCLPVEGCAAVAGRTDKGVTALRQVCSFYTWRNDVRTQNVEDAINSAAPGQLRVVSVSEVSRAFHPNFSAKWRRYFYIFPFNNGENRVQISKSEGYVEAVISNSCCQMYECTDFKEGSIQKSIVNDKNELQAGKKPTLFSISKVNLLLQNLEGKLLSYKMFARDTKAARNVGPATECIIYHARAVETRLPCPDQSEGTKVMCIELVANRFLRKMVRVLVATSIREAAAGAEADALLQLMNATCRRATAPPAPPDGLCLADVGYTEFDPRNCLIY